MVPGSQIKGMEESVIEEENPSQVCVVEKVPTVGNWQSNSALQGYLSRGREDRHLSTGSLPALLRGTFRDFNGPTFSCLETTGSFRENLEAEKRIDSQGTVGAWSRTFSPGRTHPL